MTSFDAIIIGAGHNGLVAAGFLAKAGKKILVLEASDRIGGAINLAHIVNRLSPAVVSGLAIDPNSLAGELLPTIVLDPDKGPVILRGGYGEILEGVTAAEAQGWAGMRKKLLMQAAVLKRFLAKRPPRPGDIAFSDMVDLGLTGLGLIRNGRDEARDFARMALMNVADIADEYLTDDRLKGLIAFDATLGIHLGPRSPTSLLGLYYRLTGEANGSPGGQFLPKGGMAAIASALEKAAVKYGAQIRLDAPVARILSERGRTTGVVLNSGEEILAPVIVSAIHPVTTLRKLAAPGEIDTHLSTSLKHVRTKGDAAKLTLTLDKIPAFTGVSAADLKGRLVIARSIAHVESAFNPAKYGAFSPDPVMEITLPSLLDPSLAPSGGATLSAIVQYAPYDLREGWATGKPKFLAAIMDVLERYAPGISASVTSSELLVPPDIEARYNMPGGHWHHGELQVDQMLLNRPTFAVSGYDTPLAGLYLASAGSHPGGGISGLPGMNAAKHVLSRRPA
ncbi:NAD(P)/FAD-dependent oxidoreductase [Rhizobium sp. KVB221]|uniref:Pyridine nucleotide-disulfide oxidoreductase domain-containing protein 2 n=1 Tax=Rhizobium setariae TaxID=2801340 RepID=A0A936YS73_9HYPH|nr:NAD(P)/FAD-dependent oxidoreductase [Rhizobium setariae]MBL0371667.1 NAD(P)/FAD-dependent oxidoreductase [Rhizobium setariae]